MSIYGDNNDQPHTHKIELKRELEFEGQGAWRIHYGSTEVTVGGFRNRFAAMWGGTPRRPKEKQLHAAIEKAIHRHDDDFEARTGLAIEHENLTLTARRELEEL